MPVVLPRLSVALQHVPDFLYQAQELARKYGYVKLVLLHNILDLDLAKAQPKGDMSRTLHVATSPALLGSDLPNSVEIPWPPYPANCTIAPSRDPGLLVHILWTLIQRQIAVLVQPPGKQTTTIPSLGGKTIWATPSGSSPSLQDAFLPATENTFQLVNDLALHHRVGPLLQPSIYTPVPPLDLLLVMHGAGDTWEWLRT